MTSPLRPDQIEALRRVVNRCGTLTAYELEMLRAHADHSDAPFDDETNVAPVGGGGAVESRGPAPIPPGLPADYTEHTVTNERIRLAAGWCRSAYAASAALIATLYSIAIRVGLRPAWLLRVVAFETGRTWSPSVRPPVNPSTGKRPSSAVGLLQFLEATAASMGTTTAALASMTDVEQCRYVQLFMQRRQVYANFGDAYLHVHLPTAVGKPDDYVLYREGSDAFEGNKGLARGKNYVTRADAWNAAWAAGSPKFLLIGDSHADGLSTAMSGAGLFRQCHWDHDHGKGRPTPSPTSVGLVPRTYDAVLVSTGDNDGNNLARAYDYVNALARALEGRSAVYWLQPPRRRAYTAPPPTAPVPDQYILRVPASVPTGPDAIHLNPDGYRAWLDDLCVAVGLTTPTSLPA